MTVAAVYSASGTLSIGINLKLNFVSADECSPSKTVYQSSSPLEYPGSGV